MRLHRLFAVLLIAIVGFSSFARAEIGDRSTTVSGRAEGFYAYGSEAGTPRGVIVLCYHAVEDRDPNQSYDAVSTYQFVQQLTWLAANGYHPVSLDDILAARSGGRALPPKPVLLTFDDGYESVYTRVFPILRAFHDPAVIGLVKAWMDGRPGEIVRYGNKTMPRNFFLTWDQVREMVASGLVEVAAHSDDLHRGIPGNPQGNLEPAAITRRWDGSTRHYEDEAAYEARIGADARAIRDEIARQLGQPPRAMIWPYGEHSGLAISIYQSAGMPITMSLDDGSAPPGDLSSMPRLLVADDPEVSELVPELLHMDRPPIQRVAQVDLDTIYDPDPAQQERNIGALVERIYELGITTVYLQAFADPDGTGLARSVYFPNRLLPMRSDLFNRVAWQLRTRARVDVYGWLPVLSFDFGANAPSSVVAVDSAGRPAAPSAGAYHRLSPFDGRAREMIAEVYEDLGRYGPINGLLFHDDAELSDFEDGSPAALAAYQRAGFPPSVAAIRADKTLFERWSRFKTEALIDFTHELAARVARYRMPLKTVRNIYAPLVLDPQSETWFAQNFDRFLASYDYTAIEAMPLLEHVPREQADDWLDRLVAAVAEHPGGLVRSVFELQAVDWTKPEHDTNRIVPAGTLAHEMRLLQRHGALNFGYYPDDVIAGHPDERVLHSAISLQSYEYTP